MWILSLLKINTLIIIIKKIPAKNIDSIFRDQSQLYNASKRNIEMQTKFKNIYRGTALIIGRFRESGARGEAG